MALEWTQRFADDKAALFTRRPPNDKEEWFEFFGALALVNTRIYKLCVVDDDTAAAWYFNNAALAPEWKRMAALYRSEILNGQNNS